MIGKTILHYKVFEKLGEGGMGVVYKAEDTKLKRDVAIKFLPRQIAVSAEERERFKIEAQAAAALNHPNIATIHAIEEHDDETRQQPGTLFIVMEYIEGKELGEIIQSEIPNPKSAVDYAIQIAEGLQAAHEKGVVHRDIKSTNIMVTDKGQVKIMDFGLAKIRGGAQVTKVGTTLGTAAYMSPEQAKGENTDHRTDIWAFGVVLYEMLTGQLPFKGEYEQAVTYAILNEEPVSINNFHPDIPEGLQAIVQKSMAKQRNERYQSVGEILADLEALFDAGDTRSQPGRTTAAFAKESGQKPSLIKRRLTFAIPAVLLLLLIFFFMQKRKPTLDTPAARKMLVVLPFENLGPPADEYFAGGITEEITSRLAVVHGLGIISRTSAMQYRNTQKSIATIGKELDVDYVLEGTVRWQRTEEGSRVRVTPQLIRVADDTHLWTKTYDRILDEIFAVQTEVAEEIVRQLDLTLLEPERKALQARPTRNLQAYDFYLRGKQYREGNYYDLEPQERAVEMFEKAIALDSTFASAFAQLSRTHSHIYFFTLDPSEARMAQAKAAADKALRLQPDLAEAQEALAYYYYRNKNFDRALEIFEAIRRARPNYSPFLIGLIQRRQGKWLESNKNLEEAFKLAPRDANLAVTLVSSYTQMRDFKKAAAWAVQAALLEPDNLYVKNWRLLNIINWRGQTEKAWSIVESFPEDRMKSFWVFYLLRIDRDYEQALKVAKGLPWEALEIQWIYDHKYLELAEIYWLQKNQQQCRAYADSARIILERETRQRPDVARLRSALGLAYAYLGQQDAAIREGRRAVELFPVSQDAVEGPEYVQYLAQIYAIVGESDLAIEKLDYLMSIPSLLSVARLKVDPMWDSLRGNPAFQGLIERYPLEGL
jgi:TolB-like protein/predicted Ser/Thr protein kinase/Flp pilus assembly protein TadD